MELQSQPGLLIALAGCATVVILVPTVLAMKQEQRKRECLHLERMKALELGRPFPSTQAWPALAVIALGAIMPISVFLIAWLGSMHEHIWSPGYYFIPAAIVGGCGIWAGFGLGMRLVVERASSKSNDKHALDPEAFDVVGRRG